jgi:hypothetical protein
MKTINLSMILYALLVLTLTFCCYSKARAASILYVFEDLDGDETFNVSAQVSVGDGSTGLATYVVGLIGLDDVPSIDPLTVSWAENVLSNLSTTFVSTGFQAGLLSGPVGTNEYSATNSQFNIGGAMYGVGQIPIFVEPAVGPPNNEIIDLDAIALLGQLTIPGANGFSDEELNGLLNPDAALFASDDPIDVVNPTSMTAVVNRIPEPATLMLAGLGMIGLVCSRRRRG